MRSNFSVCLALVAMIISLGAMEAYSKDTPRIWGKNPTHADLCGKYSKSWKNRNQENSVDDAYNRLAFGQINESIADGFIISMEKGSRKSISAKGHVHFEQLKQFRNVSSIYPQAAKVRDKWFKKQFNDPKPQFISHIIEFKNGQKSTVFNQHQEINANIREQLNYRDGISALNGQFQKRLDQRLKNGGFTHVFFMAMGWHNDQRVSICRYRVFMEQTKRHYDGNFKPLVIGLTWPSSWFSDASVGFLEALGHLLSVFNKANDADEVGHLYGNIILNKVIPKANKTNLPVIAIGHSFGTRVIGHSIFSRTVLKSGSIGAGAKLAIQLQPAHSVYRFVVNGGAEGYPFAKLKNLKTKFVVTSSRKDDANALAKWTKYLGGKRGLKKAISLPETFEVVVGQPSAKQAVAAIRDTKFVTILEADKFIFNHNDVMGPHIGKLIAGLVKKYAK